MRRALAAAALACAALPALAHVTVVPVESQAGATQRYGVVVPGEKVVPTTRIELQIPEGLQVAHIDEPPGWNATAGKDSRGRIVSATWAGGSIPQGQAVEFGVVARNPEDGVELAWKAIQTYRDGSEVHWNGPSGAQFPAAFTTVRAAQREGTQVVSWLALAASILALVVASLAWRRAGRP